MFWEALEQKKGGYISIQATPVGSGKIMRVDFQI